jgi:hypothetical protein
MAKTIYFVIDQNHFGPYNEAQEMDGLFSSPWATPTRAQYLKTHLGPGEHYSTDPYIGMTPFLGSYQSFVYRGLVRANTALLNGLTPIAADLLLYDCEPNPPATIVTLTDAAAAHTPATDPDFSVSLGEHVTAVVSDGTYLYAALATSPAQVVKIDPASMAEAGRWKGIANENTATSLAYLGGSLFAGLNTAPGQVVKIDVADMTTLGKWTGDIDEKYVWALASDGAYVYAGTGQFPFSIITAAAFVIKIDPATMSKAARYADAANSGINSLLCEGGFVYASLDCSPSMVRKINTTTMALAAFFTAPYIGIDARRRTLALAFGGGFLFASSDYTSYAPARDIRVWKINPATMTQTASYTGTVNTEEVLSLAYLGGNLYAGFYTYPGKLVRIDPASMTVSATANLSTGENTVYAMHTDGVYLYLGLYANPGQVIKFDPATMSKTAQWSAAAVVELGSINVLQNDPAWASSQRLIAKPIPFTALGLTKLNKSGYTKIGIRSGKELNILNSTPVDSVFVAARDHENLGFAQIVEISEITASSAWIAGKLSSVLNGSPMLLKVDVSEGSGVISNMDIRFGYIKQEELSLSPTNRFSYAYPGVLHTPWRISQEPFIDFNESIADLIPEKNYLAWPEWRFSGENNIYWRALGTYYLPDPLTFFTTPRAARFGRGVIAPRLVAGGFI